MVIFEAIRQDHDIQKVLCNKLVKTEGDTAIRAQIFKALQHEQAIYANAEERHFYVSLINEEKCYFLPQFFVAHNTSIQTMS